MKLKPIESNKKLDYRCTFDSIEEWKQFYLYLKITGHSDKNLIRRYNYFNEILNTGQKFIPLNWIFNKEKAKLAEEFNSIYND